MTCAVALGLCVDLDLWQGRWNHLRRQIGRGDLGGAIGSMGHTIVALLIGKSQWVQVDALEDRIHMNSQGTSECSIRRTVT